MNAGDRMTKMQRPDEQGVDKIIGRNLRAFRLQKNMSQEQIAAAVKLTFQQVQKYEKGSNRISGSRMAQFCQLLNVTPNDFFKGVAGVNHKGGGSNLDTSFLATKDGVAIAQAFTKIENRNHRRIIIELIESLVDK
jgi:transcriptional regulator with XRE-family HTH domain